MRSLMNESTECNVDLEPCGFLSSSLPAQDFDAFPPEQPPGDDELDALWAREMEIREALRQLDEPRPAA